MLLVGTVLPVSGTVIITNKTSSSKVSGNTLYVGGSGPGNYTKIGAAIWDAVDGDTVFVYDDSSPYYESVTVDKQINLIGENRETTVIDGFESLHVVYVSAAANRVNISGFTIQNGYTGIDIYLLGHSNVTGNIISNSSIGIRLRSSSGNIISDNSFFNDGLFVSYSYDNNVENNMVNGKPLVYLEDESDKVIDYEVGQVILVNCNKITVENLYLSNTYVGIELWKTDNSMIRNNDISNNRLGLYLYESSGNNITGNTISNNENGIYLSYSKSNTLTNNIISNNENGIYLSGHTGGFDLGKIFYDGSNNNIILKNNFLGNEPDAFFQNSFSNQWMQNYWNRPRILPKFISGEIYWIIFKPWMGTSEIHIPWFPQIDWNPAKEPYDI
jgi:parallel beta-helix repeat protein